MLIHSFLQKSAQKYKNIKLGASHYEAKLRPIKKKNQIAAEIKPTLIV